MVRGSSSESWRWRGVCEPVSNASGAEDQNALLVFLDAIDRSIFSAVCLGKGLVDGGHGACDVAAESGGMSTGYFRCGSELDYFEVLP